MDERHRLMALKAIAALQAVRAAIARNELIGARALLTVAEERSAEQADRCEAALDRWHRQLTASRPDPHHLAATGDWVVEQEKRLAAVRLDEAIARRTRDGTAREMAERAALRDVSARLHGALERRVRQKDEERQILDAAERHLRRRA